MKKKVTRMVAAAMLVGGAIGVQATAAGAADQGALTSKEQCKNGGYAHFGFKNQGQCVSSLNKPPAPPVNNL